MEPLPLPGVQQQPVAQEAEAVPVVEIAPEQLVANDDARPAVEMGHQNADEERPQEPLPMMQPM